MTVSSAVPLCCYIPCENPATHMIAWGTSQPDQYTESCGNHIVQLIGDDEYPATLYPISHQEVDQWADDD